MKKTIQWWNDSCETKPFREEVMEFANECELQDFLDIENQRFDECGSSMIAISE